jgi:hypothetical protein
MDHAEKLKFINQFNELAQNGEYAEAVDMIIADFDVSMFSLPSRKKFVQYVNSNLVQDTEYSIQQKNHISKRLKILQTLTEKMMDNSLTVEDSWLSTVDPHIRIGYGLSDMFASHADFCLSLDYCGDNYTYNKLVSLFFSKLDLSNAIHLSRKPFYLAKILDNAGRNRRKISLQNTKDFLDFGLTSVTHGYNIEGLFALDSSLAAEVAKMVADSKNKEVSGNFFTACCERNNLEYLVPMLDSGYKSITNGINIGIERQHYGMATLILKYKPRKFTFSMIQWLMDKYGWYSRRYYHHISHIRSNRDSSSKKRFAEEATQYAKMSVDIINCLQYAIDRGLDNASDGFLKSVIESINNDYLSMIDSGDMTIFETFNIPAFRCFDKDLKQKDSHESKVVR